MMGASSHAHAYALSNPEKLLQPYLLLLEDDERLGGIVEQLLEDDYRVDWILSGGQAETAFLNNSYDISIFDRRLPDMDGLQLVRRLRACGVTTPILMLTALGEVDDIVEGLDAGANDYLTKPFSVKELNARLRALLRSGHVDAGDLMIGNWIFRAQGDLLESPQGQAVQLTATESTLLKVMCDSPKHVFSRTELLRTAFRSGATDNTVDTYVSYIRQKTTHDLILTVRGKGYMIGLPKE